MHCMKCGREIPDSQIFCDSCLKVMDAYPVKSDTMLQLPKRDPRPEKKRVQQASPAETIRQQKIAIRWLALTVLVLFVAFCLVSGLLLQKLSGGDVASSNGSTTPLGQNYSTNTTP